MLTSYRDNMRRIRPLPSASGHNTTYKDASILSANSIALAQHIDVLLQIVDIPHFSRRRFAIHCDDRQLEIFRRCSRRTLLNCSRQSGKSTVTAINAVHCAYWKAGVTILVTAPTKQQTREFLSKVRTFATLFGADCPRISAEFLKQELIILLRHAALGRLNSLQYCDTLPNCPETVPQGVRNG